MSQRLVSASYEIELPQHQRELFRAYCSHANEDDLAWPGKELLAWELEISERQVQRLRRQLEESGLLEVHGRARGGRGKTTMYRVRPDRGKKKDPLVRKGDTQTSLILPRRRKVAASAPVKGDIQVSPFTAGKGDTSGGNGSERETYRLPRESERETYAAVKGDIQMSPERKEEKNYRNVPPYPPQAGGDGDLFSIAMKTYPKRSGANSRPAALRQWTARVREGVPEEELLAGVQRYARWALALEKAGTEYVYTAKRFFGRREKLWAEAWSIPAGNGLGGKAGAMGIRLPALAPDLRAEVIEWIEQNPADARELWRKATLMGTGGGGVDHSPGKFVLLVQPRLIRPAPFLEPAPP